MSIIIQDQVLKQIKVLYKSGFNLRGYFADGADVTILQGHFDILEREYKKLCEFLPDDFNTGSQLGRHVSCIRRYLGVYFRTIII
jgi:hypothetical protein